MSTLDRATDIRLKDGTLISVHSPGGTSVIVTTPPDEAADASGLSAYRSAPVGNNGMAMHETPPVETVRAYCRAHGGVAEAGETALALLKTLPYQADPVMGAPVTDSRPPAPVEAVPESPLPPARGADVAGRAEAPAAPRALDQPIVERGLQLDELTEAVIEARKAVADFEGPVVWKKSWGKHAPDRLPEVAALWRRISKGSGLASRLIIVTHPRYASHPLQAEGARLRAKLQIIADEAFAMKKGREEDESRDYQRLNGVVLGDHARALSARLRESLS